MFSGEGSFPPSTDDSNPEALRELRYSFGVRPELPTSAQRLLLTASRAELRRILMKHLAANIRPEFF